MDELGRVTVVVVATLALTFAPAFAAIWLLQRRKRTARRLRRSPLAGSLLRSPGQSLRNQIEDRRTRRRICGGDEGLLEAEP